MVIATKRCRINTSKPQCGQFIAPWEHHAIVVLILILTTTASAVSGGERHGEIHFSASHDTQQTARRINSATGKFFEIPPFAIDLTMHHRIHDDHDHGEFELDDAFIADLEDVTASYLELSTDYMVMDELPMYAVESVELNANVVLLPSRNKGNRTRRRLMEISSDALLLRATFSGIIRFERIGENDEEASEESVDRELVGRIISWALVKDEETAQPAAGYVIAIRNSLNEDLSTVESVSVYTNLDLGFIEKEAHSIDPAENAKATKDGPGEEKHNNDAIAAAENKSDMSKSVAVICGIVVAITLIFCIPFSVVQYRKKQQIKRRDEEYFARQNSKDLFQDEISRRSNPASVASSRYSKSSHRSGRKTFNKADIVGRSTPSASSAGFSSARSVQSNRSASSRSWKSTGSGSSRGSSKKTRSSRVTQLYEGGDKEAAQSTAGVIPVVIGGPQTSSAAAKLKNHVTSKKKHSSAASIASRTTISLSSIKEGHEEEEEEWEDSSAHSLQRHT
uniref:Uncharacterized protein n=1 Tax=Ditylum brightwellii TaxID=49249 RepID=A0A7S4RM35_9STRA|mmetsp:Transcript_4848/g.6313  ORF Transcript_4848/g.6313 Transcript_4848/m.6313 type:complete len:509 (-) Transcript_4848:949-2475(-)